MGILRGVLRGILRGIPRGIPPGDPQGGSHGGSPERSPGGSPWGPPGRPTGDPHRGARPEFGFPYVRARPGRLCNSGFPAERRPVFVALGPSRFFHGRICKWNCQGFHCQLVQCQGCVPTRARMDLESTSRVRPEILRTLKWIRVKKMATKYKELT